MTVRPFIPEATDALFRAGGAVVDVVIQAAQWFGRTVYYLKDLTVEYALKALDYGVCFFNATKDFVLRNPQFCALIGGAVVVGLAGFALAGFFFKSKVPAHHQPVTVTA